MNTIEETIKNAGFGKRKMVSKQIELFEQKLQEDETLLGVVMSHPKQSEQLYVTNKRIFSNKIKGVFSNENEEIPIEKISSVNVNTTLLKGASIEIITSGNKIKVEGVQATTANGIKQLIDSLIL